MRKPNVPAQGSENQWSLPELDWFSKNSYNLAIKNVSIWNPRNLLRMLVCCIAFIDQYPNDIGEPVSEDLSLRKIFCEFSAATALVSLARGEDVVEVQLQHYLNLRKHIDIFDTLLQDKLGKIEDGPAEDLLQKLAVLIGFDFEAACQLKAWDTIGEVILKAEMCKNLRVYELMADCILSSKAPTPGELFQFPLSAAAKVISIVLVSVLKQIVNKAWELESLDSTKLAKYMRCLFQVALTDSPNIAEGLLKQVCNLAQDAAEVRIFMAYQDWSLTCFRSPICLTLKKNSNGLLRKLLTMRSTCIAVIRTNPAETGRTEPFKLRIFAETMVHWRSYCTTNCQA
jgi:hypothetical protein